MEPKVHIVLASYNGEKFLRQQVETLAAQTYKNLSVEICDDGSSDGTVELAKQVTVQWLMASPAKPDAVQYKNVLALRSYDWMDNRKELAASISLRRHGGLKTE